MLNFEVITKDPEIGKKLLIGSLLALSGVGLIALVGWMLEIIRRVQRDEPPELPAFDEIGTLFVDGLKAMAIGLAWSLPIALPVIAMALVIVFLTGSSNNPDDLVGPIVLLNFCIVGLVFVFTILVLILVVPAFGLLAETGDLKQAIDPRKAIAIFRINPGGFLLAALLGLMINSLLGSLGSILCLVGIYPAMTLSYALQGQLFGKAYRDSKKNKIDTEI
ncbi:MAG TPA: DUF4013 domain-containing protein [Anaerolineales bacterium]|nr:DUF4013 domain-containing protein [Anaerolineales bacterium]